MAQLSDTLADKETRTKMLLSISDFLYLGSLEGKYTFQLIYTTNHYFSRFKIYFSGFIRYSFIGSDNDENLNEESSLTV